MWTKPKHVGNPDTYVSYWGRLPCGSLVLAVVSCVVMSSVWQLLEMTAGLGLRVCAYTECDGDRNAMRRM